MNISKLIENLQDIKNKHGDLEVFYEGHHEICALDVEHGEDCPKKWNMPDKFLLVY